MRPGHDPDGRRLPVKLDSTTNGEFAPTPREVLDRRLRSDRIDRARAAYRAERHAPSFLTYGPRTRREVLALRSRDERPA